MSGPQVAMSSDGQRLHLQHGPIDLIVEADGPSSTRADAYHAAIVRFDGLLDELVGELSVLRTALDAGPTPPTRGRVATRMVEATWPYRNTAMVTPMAAVAGAVADEIAEAMAEVADLERWMVNNGGDIALGLRAGNTYRVGVVADPLRGSLQGTLVIEAGIGVGGLATSGRHGRSFSLGIADAVTALASSAADADVAATLIANQVDVVGHPEIRRRAARDLDPDTDLGDTPVTADVGPLTTGETHGALSRGLTQAEHFVDCGLIRGAILHLRGEMAATTSVRFAAQAAADGGTSMLTAGSVGASALAAPGTGRLL